jgi:hypothetical protein
MIQHTFATRVHSLMTVVTIRASHPKLLNIVARAAVCAKIAVQLALASHVVRARAEGATGDRCSIPRVFHPAQVQWRYETCITLQSESSHVCCEAWDCGPEADGLPAASIERFSTNGAENKGGGQRENVPGVVRRSTGVRCIRRQNVDKADSFCCGFMHVSSDSECGFTNKQTTPTTSTTQPLKKHKILTPFRKQSTAQSEP